MIVYLWHLAWLRAAVHLCMIIGSSVFLWRLLRGREAWSVFFLYYAVTLVVWPSVSRLHGEFIACVVSVPLWGYFWYWFDTREKDRSRRATR